MAKRLRCALLGLAGEGQALLDAVVANRALELVAVGDPDHPALRATAERFRAEAFVDCRLLLVETTPEAVFVALPAHQATEHLRTAAEHGIGVFQLTPWATEFQVAAELTDTFQQQGCPYVIARPWSVEPAYGGLRKVKDLLGRVHTIEAQVVGRRRDEESWRADVRRAGGGTLLQDAYEQIDMVVTLCGLPEQVFSASSWVPGPGEPRPYDTEDAMAVVCKYAHDRLATIASRRAAEQPDWGVILRGSKASAQITPHRMRVTGPTGERIADKRVWRRNSYAAVVGAFTTSLLEGAAWFASTARDHLPTVAVMQAAYLSAKTGEPESPAKFLDLAAAG